MHVGIQWVHVGRCVSNVIRLDGDSKWQNTLYVGIQKNKHQNVTGKLG